MSFGKKLAEVRQKTGLSMYELGLRAGLPRTVIWKTEHGKSLPKPETLSQLAKGLGIAEGSRAWKDLYSIWSADRTGNSLSNEDLAGAITHAKTSSAKSLRSFSAALEKLSKEDFAEIQKAITRPSVLAGLRTLNALYESKT